MVFGQRRLEYAIALLLALLGAAGLAFAVLSDLSGGHLGILAAASLMVMASGLMLWYQNRSQTTRLYFDNPRRTLFFAQRDGLTVPIPYSRIYKIEAYHVKSADTHTWIVGAHFHDGNVLPLLSGSEKRMRARQQEISDWIALEKSRPGQPSRKTGALTGKLTRGTGPLSQRMQRAQAEQAAQPENAKTWEPIPLPPLPAWLGWHEDDGMLRCSWHSRMRWRQILFPTAFVLSFALICFFSAQPAEELAFWALRGFSAFLSLLALVMLGHGMRTRLRSWWLELGPDTLSCGYRRPFGRRDILCKRFDDMRDLHLYWSFEVPRLTALDDQAEAELQRKQRLNPSYSLLAILQLMPPSHRLEIQLSGFSQGEILLLQEHLMAWYNTQKPQPDPHIKPTSVVLQSLTQQSQMQPKPPKPDQDLPRSA